MKTKLIFLLFIINASIPFCFSQEKADTGKKILFRGLVLDASDFKPIPNSQIIINRIIPYISDIDGSFAFYVNRKDTIVFNSLGYKKVVFLVSDTLKGDEFNAGIYMHTDTLSIGEVIIVSRYKNLKSEILNAESKTPSTFDNARYNVAVSAYQGRNSQGNLGDPGNNYAVLVQKQKVDAYEKGGIPSDKIVSLNPLILIPAAYLLIKGSPEKPGQMVPRLTEQEVNQIHKKYMESLEKKK
ncbi:MAG TPA: hypothetical protein PLR88_12380 [Bacteroidales bacterium]|nr:hypothetical protein [Bacteroidales bacterium]HPT22734.1 hypothetical protein [Bacteroidales bacterium]